MLKVLRNSSSKKPSLIFTDDILDFGWEKAYILANVDFFKYGDGTLPKEEDLWENFPMFEKKKFYRLLNQLIKAGLLYRSEV